MRKAFISELIRQAEKNERIYLLCGDLGYTVLEQFSDRFPRRFINIGIAEQNMIGIATGLALSGKIVFTYSITNFTTLRCLEQIRNDVCYHNANVNIISVGCGLAYGPQGYTHHGVEDIALMRVLPNMTVLSPADPIETELATRAIINNDSPSYLRIGKSGNTLYDEPPLFALGKAIYLRRGNDITLISTGEILQMSLDAANHLANSGIDVQVMSMPTLYPFDSDAICDAAEQTGHIITIEEHSIGGLASATAEILSKLSKPIKFFPMHLKREINIDVGSQEYLLAKQGISVENIIKTAKKLLYEK